MKAQNLSIMSLVLSALTISACGKKADPAAGSVDQQIEESAESAVASVGAIADDQSMSSGFAMNKSRFESAIAMLKQGLLPAAQAAACQRALSQACNSGIREINYSACEISFSALVIDDGDNNPATPSVQLAYSNNSCLMTSPGDHVDRTYDYKIVGPRGGNLRVSSQSLGDSASGVVGGGRLTYNGGSDWTIQILGKNKVLSTPNGRELFSHSIQTTQDIEISGGLARSGRLVKSGAVRVYHNLKNFNVTHTFTNLQYTGTCCHPVSGSISSVAEGSVNKSYSIEFNGCGSAKITDADGNSRELTITYCE